MTKQYQVTDKCGRSLKNGFYADYDSAVNAAKRFAKDYEELYITATLAKVAAPLPEATVTEIQ